MNNFVQLLNISKSFDNSKKVKHVVEIRKTTKNIKKVTIRHFYQIGNSKRN